MDQLGDPRKSHPIPIRLRNQYIGKDQGGASGYRGPGYAKARLRALYLGRYRSSITGLPADRVKFQIDHIIPYRVGGLTPHTNEQSNLRISDFNMNKFIDYAEGAQEKPALRRLRAF